MYEGTAPLWLNPPLLLLPPPVMPEPSRAGSPESQPLPGPTLSPLAPNPLTPVGLVKNTLKEGKQTYIILKYILYNKTERVVTQPSIFLKTNLVYFRS